MNSNIYFNDSTRVKSGNSRLAKNAKAPSALSFVLAFIERIIFAFRTPFAKSLVKGAASVCCLAFVVSSMCLLHAGTIGALQGIIAGISAIVIQFLILKR